MKVTSNKAAARWGEAYPLGNGRMGAMVYGGVSEERIDLSELTFFSGSRSGQNNQPGAAAAFEKMRKEALSEEFDEMVKTAEGVIGVRGNYGTNLPVGSLLIQTNQREEQVSGYGRRLELRDGTAVTDYRYQECICSRICFMEHSQNVMVFRMKAAGGVFDAGIAIRTPRSGETVRYGEKRTTFTGQALEQMHSDGQTGTRLFGGFSVYTDGRVSADTGGFHVEGASEILLYLTMVTEFESECREETVRKRLDQAESVGAAELLKRHREDMCALYERSTLELSGAAEIAVTRIPLMYQMGRYLLYSSSREDSLLPAHLQGIWNDNVACRIGWTCDMHLDINTQMNYWPAESTNLPETVTPLMNWINGALVPNGRQTAKKTYGYPGWVAELVSNAWGFAAPYWAEPIAPCPTGGMWILTHLWEHFRFSRDEQFLRNQAFPAMEEAARFFDAYLFEDDAGELVGGPSISPENSFTKDGKTFHNSIGCTYEILMIRELFAIYIEACSVLSRHGKLLKNVADKIGRLKPYRIMADGTLAEWAHNYPAADPQHRHTSHLLGVFPFAQITPDDEELAGAVQKTIERRLIPEENWEDTGWARSMLMLYEARLLRPERAYHHIGAMLENLLEPNGMIIHPPTRGAGAFDNVYELDGNTGLTSCISEMLLQSHRGYIDILPCLPKAWRKGRISGLRARGNVLVDIKWSGQLVKVCLTAKYTGQYQIRCGERTQTILLKAGETEKLEWRKNSVSQEE